jgi:hypothetical protein
MDTTALDAYKSMVETLLGVPVTSITLLPTGIVINVAMSSAGEASGVAAALSPTAMTDYLTPLGLAETVIIIITSSSRSRSGLRIIVVAQHVRHKGGGGGSP